MSAVPSTQSQSNAPIPISRLSNITIEACDSVFQAVSSYDHASTNSWNTTLINRILETLIAETSAPDQQPQYKYIVNTTIFEQGRSGTEDGGVSLGVKKGMHAAQGAYWNNEKDGSWNYKYDQSDTKGFDVIISIIWVSTV